MTPERASKTLDTNPSPHREVSINDELSSALAFANQSAHQMTSAWNATNQVSNLYGQNFLLNIAKRQINSQIAPGMLWSGVAQAGAGAADLSVHQPAQYNCHIVGARNFNVYGSLDPHSAVSVRFPVSTNMAAPLISPVAAIELESSKNPALLEGSFTSSADGAATNIPEKQRTMEDIIQYREKIPNHTFDKDMPTGPWVSDDEAVNDLREWARSGLGNGAFGIVLATKRKDSSKSGRVRRLTCDCAGNHKSKAKSIHGRKTLTKKCGCPWALYLENIEVGWVERNMCAA
ncbi:MAG: hypothetical protein ACREOZ_04560, partial [Gloeomargaritales cyanobacterium]